MERDEQMIAALKRERAGYAARGDDDRVAGVDEQLKEFGYDATQDADPAAAGPYVPPPVTGPRGRTAAAGQQTAAGTKQGAKTGKAATTPTTAKPGDKLDGGTGGEASGQGPKGGA